MICLPTELNSVEDVSILQHTHKPPLAKTEDLDDEFLPTTMASNSERKSSLTLTPDEEMEEEEVECLDLFYAIVYWRLI